MKDPWIVFATSKRPDGSGMRMRIYAVVDGQDAAQAIFSQKVGSTVFLEETTVTVCPIDTTNSKGFEEVVPVG